MYAAVKILVAKWALTDNSTIHLFLVPY
jgi:hypothetical protein